MYGAFNQGGGWKPYNITFDHKGESVRTKGISKTVAISSTTQGKPLSKPAFRGSMIGDQSLLKKTHETTKKILSTRQCRARFIERTWKQAI